MATQQEFEDFLREVGYIYKDRRDSVLLRWAKETFQDIKIDALARYYNVTKQEVLEYLEP